MGQHLHKFQEKGILATNEIWSIWGSQKGSERCRGNLTRRVRGELSRGNPQKRMQFIWRVRSRARFDGSEKGPKRHQTRWCRIEKLFFRNNDARWDSRTPCGDFQKCALPKAEGPKRSSQGRAREGEVGQTIAAESWEIMPSTGERLIKKKKKRNEKEEFQRGHFREKWRRGGRGAARDPFQTRLEGRGGSTGSRTQKVGAR